MGMKAEQQRLSDNRTNGTLWGRWGPYLSYRQWGTVREDYSTDGTAWDYFPHDHARSRAYRWGEDGIFGFCDRHGIINVAPAFWNEADPILKERFFGLTNIEGNHGEDVKEEYFHLSGCPSHAYMKALYKYPHAAYPYGDLVMTNKSRTQQEREYELVDTGVFNDEAYFDILVEYAKVDEHNFLSKVSAINRGSKAAPLHILLQAWMRNRWTWDGHQRPQCVLDNGVYKVPHNRWGDHFFVFSEGGELLFTENETHQELLFGSPSASPYVKDAFHRHIIGKEEGVVNPVQSGTKFAAHYSKVVQPGETWSVYCGLGTSLGALKLDKAEQVFATRKQECEEFYAELMSIASEKEVPADAQRIAKQGFASLLWTKQIYHLNVARWLDGDSAEPPVPGSHKYGRNSSWRHMYCGEVLSMPDKWEYPWFAAWDLAFHTIPFALIDPEFAKNQLITLMREWYMHPNGQIPAYEWAFSDVNPPVHAWAAWRIYTIERRLTGKGDKVFLERVFLKLLLNFTWWINRKDRQGNNIFEGGFLGLDNIGLFDRNMPLGDGVYVEQADGTSWMAMFCLNMLTIAIELADESPAYEDIATKFFEHFLGIAQAMNDLEKDGLWCDADGFYYDLISWPDGTRTRAKVRSVVGLIPIFAVTTLDSGTLEKLDGFRQRMDWYLKNVPHMMDNIENVMVKGQAGRHILSLVPKARLEKILQRLFDTTEFLGEHGIRAVSKYHQDHPVSMELGGHHYMIDYEPAESTSGLFGGNSNWRGPIWFPINYLIVETIQRIDFYYGGDFKVTVEGKEVTLGEAAAELERRLLKLFSINESSGARPFQGEAAIRQGENWRNLIQFHEYFDGDTGRGLGACQQAGWTALIAKIIDQLFVTSEGGWARLE